MPRPTLSIHPKRRETAEVVRYDFDLRYANSSPREVVFYAFPRDHAPLPTDNFDGIRCAVILRAMAGGRDIRLCGPATNAALLNLDEFQLAYLLSAEFSNVLVGSCRPYDKLGLPCGSNPVTDRLLSGGSLHVIRDGAAFSRVAKVAFLSAFPAALLSLKVCWQGEDQGRNCGACEKCVRTLLNFLVAGISNPPGFDAPLDLRRIPHIRISNEPLLGEYLSIIEYAESRNIDAERLRLLRNRVGQGKTNSRTPKQLIKISLAKAGLLDTITSAQEKLKRRGIRRALGRDVEHR